MRALPLLYIYIYIYVYFFFFFFFAEWALNILFVAKPYRLKWNFLLSVASCFYSHW